MNPVMQLLSGTWFILSTNFPMWLDGTKTHPTFNYSIAERKGKTVLYDEVHYVKNGKTKKIKGYDHQDPKNEKAFIWRGKGLLWIAKSNWEIRLMDEKNEWAVIWFSKTAFTPEGVDIISKSTYLDRTTIDSIMEKMKSDAVLKKHIPQLKELPRSTPK